MRRKPGAEQGILDTLQVFGMQWDRPPVRQSERGALYLDALDRLIARRLAYRCNCSRKVIAAMARVGLEGPVYPGTCRGNPPPGEVEAAWRVAVDDAGINFRDRVVGETRQDLAQEIGDFVVHRIDGFAAYQLAVVVDDHAQGITDVVRGADLLWSTPRQIWLQRALGLDTPRYAHVPLVYGSDGHKLSKRDQAHPVDETDPLNGLRAAWAHLGQQVPPQQLRTSADFWDWAIPHWDMGRVPQDRNRRHERSDSL
jgi:glutamyl-Q tRNA(Asp) synthetase